MPEEPSEDGEMNQGNETALSEALKKQHSKCKPWWSEAEQATSRRNHHIRNPVPTARHTLLANTYIPSKHITPWLCLVTRITHSLLDQCWSTVYDP